MTCRCDPSGESKHETYGACLRAKNLRVAYCQSSRNLDASAEKTKERELDLYAAARRQGIQPASTFTRDVRRALDASDATGTAFDAGKGPM